MFHRVKFRKHDKTLLTILVQPDLLYTAQTPTLANSSMLVMFCPEAIIQSLKRNIIIRGIPV